MERYYKCVVLFLGLVIIPQSCLCANSNVPCIQQEVQALLDFKASIAQHSSNKLSSWKGSHCCQWEGIGCDNVTGHVVKLDLRNPCYPPNWRQHYLQYIPCLQVIAPNVSSSLLQLEHLTYLDLTGNDFGESLIPMFIGSMGRLEHLSLSDAELSGNIPNSFGNLKSLQFLDISSNDNFSYSFQIREDISWISKLHSLKHLDLSSVPINDPHYLFQVLNLLPSLSHLSLYDCQLDNSLIPHYAFQNMTNLVYLDLSFNNMLSGPIPEVFQNMTSIESLYLSRNNINSIPLWFSELDKLTLLDLSGNGLRGQIPSYAFTNLSSLVHLDLSYNQLDSVSSLSFGNLKKFVYLDLSFNEFYGPIPEVFQNMTSIESLHLSGNHFTLVPSWFCNFQKLTYLDLSMNGIHGPIPEGLRNLTSIKVLDLRDNSLTSIPSWFVELKRLVYLDLSWNQITLQELHIFIHIGSRATHK
ncbi:receptor-like protein 12 [Vicia villosa]|uniref:receptor-like protein 12 n=1 Tax=Vicia villosa TaxID=3911 RepID=UPI00273C437D|nr:receptor-like protein 12 [Vicia villosa]